MNLWKRVRRLEDEILVPHWALSVPSLEVVQIGPFEEAKPNMAKRIAELERTVGVLQGEIVVLCARVEHHVIETIPQPRPARKSKKMGIKV